MMNHECYDGFSFSFSSHSTISSHGRRPASNFANIIAFFKNGGDDYSHWPLHGVLPLELLLSGAFERC
jgi:hypothetical protein